MSALLDAALGYARKGRRVLPLHNIGEDRCCSCGGCDTPGKHPRVGNQWQHKATADEAAIRRWWSMFPNANVGYLTGSGIAVLDVDPRHGGDKDLAALELEHGTLPATAEVATGGGGRHLFYKVPPGARTRDLAEGLELKAEGAFVVAAPSIHASGKQYVWLDRCAPADAPEWLLTGSQGNGAAPPVAEKITANRNKALTSIAGTMRRRGLDETEIAAGLLAVNANRCEPPLDETEVRKIANGITRYEADVSAFDDGVEGAPPEPRESAAQSDSHETRSTSLLTSFEDIVARPVRWAWQDRIALGKITALAGRPKIGKGLAYSNVIAQVTRGELEGDLTGSRDVIVVTTEDDPGDTLKPRLMAAGADLERVSIFQMGTKDDPVPFRVPQDAAELSRRVREKNAALVVIDPLLEFVDGKLDSHKSQPVRQALAAVNQIARENGCAVLVIFHLNKGASTDPLQRHEASAAFTQVVRGGMLLGHDPDDPDGEDGRQRILAVSSSNLAAIAPSLVYEISTARVMGDTGEEIVTARMACIGESSAGAHDLLRGRVDEEEQTGTDEAEEFLMAELARGAQSADEMIKAARRLGISDKQLRRARGRLKIESEKAGFTEGWKWSLPKVPSTKAPPLPSNRGAPSTPSASRAENRPLEDTKMPLYRMGAPSENGDEPNPNVAEWERLQEMSR